MSQGFNCLGYVSFEVSPYIAIPHPRSSEFGSDMSRRDVIIVLFDHLHAGAHLCGQCVVIHAVFEQSEVGIGMA